MSEPSAMHRLARSPGRHERRRNAGDAFLDREAVLLQDVDQVAVGLEFLEAELAEAEDGVHHLLGEVLHRVDVGDRVASSAAPRAARPGAPAWPRRRGRCGVVARPARCASERGRRHGRGQPPTTDRASNQSSSARAHASRERASASRAQRAFDASASRRYQAIAPRPMT